jgi:integrase
MPHNKKEFNLTKEKMKVLKDFIEYKKVNCNSNSKINNYRYFLSLFLEYSDKNLKKYEEGDIIEFINYLNKEYSVGSINEIKWMIKSFVCWYYEDYPKRFRNLDRILIKQKKEKTYSPDQMLKKEDIEKLVQEEPEVRWKTFFLMYFYGGFRPIEVCNLKWKDISFDKEGGYVKTVSNKNHKEFQKFIPEDVCFYLKKWKNNNKHSDYVFPTKRSNKHGIPVGDIPQTRSGVYQHLIPLAKRVLNKHVNPYILRHSIATILYNRDDLKDSDVAQQMGHSKEMKETYNNLSEDKIKARMKRIWINPELTPEKKEELEEQIEKLKNDKIETKKELLEFRVMLEHILKNIPEELRDKKVIPAFPKN